MGRSQAAGEMLLKPETKYYNPIQWPLEIDSVDENAARARMEHSVYTGTLDETHLSTLHVNI